MAKLHPRYQHLEAREGLAPASVLTIADVRRAFRRTLPTRVHALQFFHALRGLLGDRGFLDETSGAAELRLHVVRVLEPRLLGAQPLVTLSRGPGRAHIVMHLRNEGGVRPADEPEDWKPGDPPYREVDLRPKVVPRGPEMCGGKVEILEGPSRFGVEYDDDGVRGSGTESAGDMFSWVRHPNTAPYQVDTLARPPSTPPISLVRRPGLRPEGHTPEELAALTLAASSDSPVRFLVHLPVPVPVSFEDLLAPARRALGQASFAGSLPTAPCWVAIDGLEGRVMVFAASAMEALEELRREAFAKKPRPPGLTETEDEEPTARPEHKEPTTKTSDDGKSVVFSTGTIEISLPPQVLPFPWPRFIPANIPAVLLELGPLPEVPPLLSSAGYSRVTRCFTPFGTVGHAFVRDEAAGFTAVGEHILDLVLPAVTDGTLDAELDAADRISDEDYALLAQPGDEAFVHRRTTYAVFDDERRARFPAKVLRGARSKDLGPTELEGDHAPWGVTRERRG